MLREARLLGTLPVSALPPKAEDEGERVQVSYKFPSKILERMKDIAKAEGYTVTDLVLHALRKLIAEYDADKAKERKR